MPKNSYIVGFDIGTRKVVAIIAEVTEERKIEIIGIGTADSHGLRKGVVVDLDATTMAIKKAREEAELMAGVEIDGARELVGLDADQADQGLQPLAAQFTEGPGRLRRNQGGLEYQPDREGQDPAPGTATIGIPQQARKGAPDRDQQQQAEGDKHIAHRHRMVDGPYEQQGSDHRQRHGHHGGEAQALHLRHAD